jgi:hypothetical protein
MGRPGFGWLSIASSGGLFDQVFVFHKERRVLFDKLSDYQFFK